MSTGGSFECSFPFNIDNGELDGMTPQQCFVMGYELCQIEHLLENGDGTPFERPVRAANEERIRRLCEQSGREFRLTWHPDDKAEYWMWLAVGPITDVEAGQP